MARCNWSDLCHQKPQNDYVSRHKPHLCTMISKEKPSVVVMGLGYIGLPTASLIASKGISVQGIDIHQEIVDTVNQGEIHIVEPDLLGLVKYNTERGYLKASTQANPADVFLIAVPTPLNADNEPDTSYIQSAVSNIIDVLKPGDLIILESTSPVGTTEAMERQIIASRPELAQSLHIAYCPERVLPGNVIYELEHNDRVIGGLNDEASDKAIEFYALFVKGALNKTTVRTAEMCKLAENSFRDLNIAFANEISMICDKAEIDPWELIRLANCHPRVNILQPGVGVGGHCIAVDPWFIVSSFQNEATIIRTARQVNVRKTAWVLEQINASIEGLHKQGIEKPGIACLGLAFKPNVDDLRESPSVDIVTSLAKEDRSELLVVEPNIDHHDQFTLVGLEDGLAKADIVLVLTAHKEFKKIPVAQLEGKKVLDFCQGLSKP